MIWASLFFVLAAGPTSVAAGTKHSDTTAKDSRVLRCCFLFSSCVCCWHRSWSCTVVYFTLRQIFGGICASLELFPLNFYIRAFQGELESVSWSFLRPNRSLLFSLIDTLKLTKLSQKCPIQQLKDSKKEISWIHAFIQLWVNEVCSGLKLISRKSFEQFLCNPADNKPTSRQTTWHGSTQVNIVLFTPLIVLIF